MVRSRPGRESQAIGSEQRMMPGTFDLAGALRAARALAMADRGEPGRHRA